MYRRKGTSFDRVYVCLLHVSIVTYFMLCSFVRSSDFLLFVKKWIRGGRTFAECNSGSLKDSRLQV